MSSYSKVWDNQSTGLDDDDITVHADVAADDPLDTQNVPGHASGRLINEPQTIDTGTERLEQRRYMGGDTLDEPVSETLMRDLRSVIRKLRQILWRSSSENERPSEWDLWGPLVFCLAISLTMGWVAPQHQTSLVFSGVFTLIWLGQIVVALNIKLLGGSISFFEALSVTGYCLFPMVIASAMTLVIRNRFLRLPVNIALVAWCIFAAARGLRGSGVLPARVFQATYPAGLFYTGLGWLCVIS